MRALAAARVVMAPKPAVSYGGIGGTQKQLSSCGFAFFGLVQQLGTKVALLKDFTLFCSSRTSCVDRADSVGTAVTTGPTVSVRQAELRTMER